MNEIRRSVELEDEAAMNTLWIENGKATAVDIEVWEVGARDTMAGHSVVPVPILESSASTAKVEVALYGGNMNPWFGRPKLEVEVTWKPKKVQDGHSSGELIIRPIRGLKFVNGNPSAQWRLQIKVPVHLFGANANQTWSSNPSTSGKSPFWDPDVAGGHFDIKWTSGEKTEPHKHKTDAPLEALLQKVLTVLDERSRKIDDISTCTATIEQRTTALEHALLDRQQHA